FFFSSRRRHTRCLSDWSSDVCSSDLIASLLGTGPMALGLLSSPPMSPVTERPRLGPAVAKVARPADQKDDRGLPEPGAGSRAPRSEERRVGKEWGARGGAEPWRGDRG